MIYNTSKEFITNAYINKKSPDHPYLDKPRLKYKNLLWVSICLFVLILFSQVPPN